MTAPIVTPTGADPIDGIQVPAGDGSTDPNHVTRDLEIVLEAEIRELVAFAMRDTDRKRVAYVITIARLRGLRLSLEALRQEGP